MESINQILNREHISEQIKTILKKFDENCKNVNFKKGIYIYGATGCGKTQFVMNLLKELNFDIIKYDAGDVRNKSLIDTITSNNVSNQNVLDMMKGRKNKIAIVMDEIDGMNNGDKGGITSLIKLIRQKKTKKQKFEDVTLNPIICIGNYFTDKKMRELMKVCNTFELKTPTTEQIEILLNKTLPMCDQNAKYWSDVLKYIQGDLRKLQFIQKLYHKNPELLNENIFDKILHAKSYNEDAKQITQMLINQPIAIDKHNEFMNESERTIVALLWHENIVDAIQAVKHKKSFPFYIKILNNMCFSDYIDRITFQNQIWQFNEMSSMIKTFYNNKIYHENFPEYENKYHPEEVRFTKVLTKYSTEYNNQLFIFNMSQELDMDKKDLISFFQETRLYYGKNFYNQLEQLDKLKNSETNEHVGKFSHLNMEILNQLFENYNISKLDIKRMYRYLDKNVKKEEILDEIVDE
jgi:SpoVK/Ycf46/Vps4 family AAA+-type ATPase